MDLLQSLFFQRALIGGILIGFAAAVIGLFLVLRRLAMIGDTLAHVSIAGVALGFLLGFYPLGMGLIFALAGTFLIEMLRQTYQTYAELSIAILMSAGVALASIFFSLGRGFNMSVSSYLFGSIYTLSDTDLWMIVGVTALVALAIFTHSKELFLLTFDERAAKVNGLPIRYMNILLGVLTALVISVSIKIVGGLLVSALLTLPTACSLLVARSFRQSLVAVVLISEFAVIVGLVIAGYLNLAPGGTIVLLLIVVLLATLLIKRKEIRV
jgi:zinc transport system permease protein